MDDLKPIIYTIIIVIYILSRIFKRAKKKSQKEAPVLVEPHTEKKPESLFETIREEIRKQQELEKSRQESKQQTPIPKKQVAKVAAKKTVLAPAQLEHEPILDSIEKEEGVSTISSDKMKESLWKEEEKERVFEFDPREAFKMKTLLERHPLV